MDPNRIKENIRKLSEEDLYIVRSVLQGEIYDSIAGDINLTPDAIKMRMKKIYIKLEIFDSGREAKRGKLTSIYSPYLMEDKPIESDSETKDEEGKSQTEELTPAVDKEDNPEDYGDLSFDEEEEPQSQGRIFQYLLIGVIISFVICWLGLCIWVIRPVNIIENIRNFLANIVQTQGESIETQILAIPGDLETKTPIFEITATDIFEEAISPLTSTQEYGDGTPTYQPTQTKNINIPSGDWSIRAYNADAANIVMVNGHIVAAANRSTHETGWVKINNYFVEGSNYVSFICINDHNESSWGFSLRHNDNIKWGHEGDPYKTGMLYSQVVEISQNGEVNEVNLQKFDETNLEGEWSARAIAYDYGVISVNGIPVSASFGGKDITGWTNIRSLLYANLDNNISVSVWNSEGSYSWYIALRKGDSILWGWENEGTGQTGEVFFDTIVIDRNGEIIQ